MRRTLGHLVACVGAAMVFVSCTNDAFDPETLPNQPPVARVWVSGPDIQPTSYNDATFYWSGTDIDGTVEGFHVSIADRGMDPSTWTYTDKDESTATYSTDDSGQAFAVLYVVAQDDRGALSDTVSVDIPLINSPPVLEFRADFEPLLESFGAASFDFFGFDLDGNETLLPWVEYRFEGSDPDLVFELDDPLAHPTLGWVREDRPPTRFSLQLREIPPGDPGAAFAQTIYVRIGDVAGSFNVLEHTWTVFEAIGKVLLVDDSLTAVTRDAFYRDALDAALPGAHSRWDIANGLPPRDDDLRLTLEQFELLVWYTGNSESQNLLRAQAVLTQYLTDRDPGTEGDQPGRLLLETPVILGNGSSLSPAFRARFGIANEPLPRNPLATYTGAVEAALGDIDIASEVPELPPLVSDGTNYEGGPGRYFGLSGLDVAADAAALWTFEPYAWGGDRDFSCRPDCMPVVGVRRPATGQANTVLLSFQLEFANALGNAPQAVGAIITDILGFAP